MSVTLGQLVKEFGGGIQTGPFGSQLHAADYVEDGIPSIMPKNIRIDGVDASDIARVSPEDIERLSKYKVQTGDIVYSRRGDVEKCSLITEQENGWLCGTGCLRVRIHSEKISPEFLHAYLCHPSVREWIVRHAVGATMPNLNTSILCALPVLVPTLGTIKTITNNWTALSNKLVVNIKINQTLEQMAQAIFKSWFVDFDPVKAKMNGEQPEGMDAATASLFPEKLVESELGLIPEGWPIDQVGNHIDLTKGISYKSTELQESTTALVTLKSFKRGGGYRMDGLKEYIGKYKPKQVIEAGDLVMSLTDVTQAAEIIGKPALVIDAPQYDTLVASLDVAILRPKATDAKQYFYGLMSTYRFHRYAESFATGTTVLHLSSKGITTFEFARPSAELVKKYHEFAEPIFTKIEANILESQELANLRDTLLPKLLSGEIELGQVAEDA
ncbi:restriction endonuclease subunit S (plasmid) [Shewanella aestuarii]|uniref:Restriction endonuclease subunit S n=2 Tax=Shewanella aestuarii TaxID=1028752 RepID=A0A6G9QPG6_9GAMM|nr:restriction endonuclease subunit S [Shewanella aestuarii]